MRSFIIRVAGRMIAVHASTPTLALVAALEDAFQEDIDAAFSGKPSAILLTDGQKKLTISIRENA